MENKTDLNTILEPALATVQVPKPKIKFPVMNLILSLLTLLFLVSAVILYYQNLKFKNILAGFTSQPIRLSIQPSPTPSAVAATSQRIWDINSGNAKSSSNIYLFAIWKGMGTSNGGNTIFFEVDIQNRSKDFIKISPNDFSLLDENGEKVGDVVINGGENPFIPDMGKMDSIDSQWQILGDVTFTNIPDKLQNGTLKFQPQVSGAKPIEFPMSFMVPVTGGQ
jgi:hypothetical protein